MIEEFVQKLYQMKENDPKTVKKIHNFPLLIEGLKDLDRMVGMKTFKADVIGMIKNYLVSNFTESNRNHSVISGAPGCGKTSLAKIVAKIYVALGMISRKNRSSISIIDETNYDINPFLLGIFSVLVISLVLNPRWLTGIALGILVLYILIFCKTTTKKNRVDLVGDDDDYFIMLKRDDLISSYLGDTVHRANSALTKCVGKVVFIDEAYKLVASRGDNDPYGNEALNALIEWMDANRGRCLVIFGGYEEDMNRTIFRSQPGLKRRCQRVYHIDPYTYEELFEIFQGQLKNKSLKITPMAKELNEIKSLFHVNREYFPFSGGDTERLVDFIEQFYNTRLFDAKATGLEMDPHVNLDLVSLGMDQLKQTQRIPETRKKNIMEELLSNIDL